jgi:hypothetical protein
MIIDTYCVAIIQFLYSIFHHVFGYF